MFADLSLTFLTAENFAGFDDINFKLAVPSAHVPEPSTLVLFWASLVSMARLGHLRRRRKSFVS